MIETLKELPQGIVGLKAVGKVSREDYTRAFEPLIDEARREGSHLRFLYQFGPEFEGFTAGGVWEDAKLGLGSMRFFDGCAIVTDIGWIRESSRLLGFLLPCPVRVFANDQRQQAGEWLRSLPEGAAVAQRLLPDRGVLVVEINQALRTQDFDALALTADTWIEAHGELQGLVIHAREFPGWEDMESVFRHMKFVRNHHRKIERVAFAADSKLMSLAPRLGEHFMKAEVKSFGYDAVEAAVAWAGTRTSESATAAPTRSSSKDKSGTKREKAPAAAPHA